MSEPGPLPDHHKKNFETMVQAAKNGHLALMSCLKAGTDEPRSVICMVNIVDGEYEFMPVGHLCPASNPFDYYGPPSADTVP